jgi:hypothetical protein
LGNRDRLTSNNKCSLLVILSETKDPYRDQESNNPILTNGKALVICTLDGFLALLPSISLRTGGMTKRPRHPEVYNRRVKKITSPRKRKIAIMN